MKISEYATSAFTGVCYLLGNVGSVTKKFLIQEPILTLLNATTAADARAAIAAMSNPMTANGDLIVQSGGVPARLAVGAEGKIIKVVSGMPVWGDAPDTTNASALTTGTLADAQLSSNVALKNIDNGFSVGQTIGDNTTLRNPLYYPTLILLKNGVGSWNIGGLNSTSRNDLRFQFNALTESLILDSADPGSVSAGQVAIGGGVVRAAGTVFGAAFYTPTVGRFSESGGQTYIDSFDGAAYQPMNLRASTVSVQAPTTVIGTDPGTVAAGQVAIGGGVVRAAGYLAARGGVLSPAASTVFMDFGVGGRGGRLMAFGPNTTTPSTLYLSVGSSDGSVYKDALIVDGAANIGLSVVPTAGNGLLQLASGTTKANGIAFGTDTFFYRSGGGVVNLAGSVSSAIGFGLDDVNGPYIGTTGAFKFRIITGSAAALTIDTSQNIGIGTAPADKLHVAGGGLGGLGALRISDAGGANYWNIGRDNQTTGNFVVSMNGTVGFTIDTSMNCYATGAVRANVFQGRTTDRVSLISANGGTQIDAQQGSLPRGLRVAIGGVETFFAADASVSINGSQVLTTTRTGWSAATGTATRSSFATSTVTTSQLAERLKALIDDLTTHGLIGA